MKILFFGDVMGKPGREGLISALSDWKKEYQPDFVLANGENLAHGRGITRQSLNEILKAGVDLVTLGDHAWDKQEVIELLEDKNIPLIRPANFPIHTPGQGFRFLQSRTKKILVLNLLGRVFMHEDYDDPFRKADAILDEVGDEAEAVIVDWHAEATSEKVCLGWYLDGRVSAVLGTHTHVPTADLRILPKGTAFVSDVGMVGVRDSSLGLNKEDAIKRFLTSMHSKMEMAEGPVEVNAVLVDIDRKGRAQEVKRLQKIVALD